MDVDPLEFEEPVAILLKEIQAMRLMPQVRALFERAV